MTLKALRLTFCFFDFCYPYSVYITAFGGPFCSTAPLPLPPPQKYSNFFRHSCTLSKVSSRVQVFASILKLKVGEPGEGVTHRRRPAASRRSRRMMTLARAMPPARAGLMVLQAFAASRQLHARTCKQTRALVLPASLVTFSASIFQVINSS